MIGVTQAELHHRTLHDTPSSTEVIGATQAAAASCVMMKRCVINAVTPDGRRRSRVFLDEGSSVTLMDRSLADELQLSGPEGLMDTKTATKVRTVETMTVELQIENSENGYKFKLKPLHVSVI